MDCRNIQKGASTKQHCHTSAVCWWKCFCPTLQRNGEYFVTVLYAFIFVCILIQHYAVYKGFYFLLQWKGLLQLQLLLLLMTVYLGLFTPYWKLKKFKYVSYKYCTSLNNESLVWDWEHYYKRTLRERVWWFTKSCKFYCNTDSLLVSCIIRLCSTISCVKLRCYLDDGEVGCSSTSRGSKGKHQQVAPDFIPVQPLM